MLNGGVHRGFSTMELSVVIVIVTILFGISAVMVVGDQASESSLITGKKKLLSLLNNARMEARLSKTAVAVIVRRNERSQRDEATLARRNELGEWQPQKRWIEIGCELERDFWSEEYPNILHFTTDELWSGCLVFDARGGLVLSDDVSENGGFMLLKNKGEVINDEDDIKRLELLYVSVDTGKVAAF